MSQLEILATGALATIQDEGRSGLAGLGVGVSGTADLRSLRLANRLVGNEPGVAGVEVTFGGFALRALADIDTAGAVGPPAQFLGARVAAVRLTPKMPGDIGHGLSELVGGGHDASRTGSPRFHASHCASASADRRSPWSHPWSRTSTSQPPSTTSLIKIAAALRAGNRMMCALTMGSST